MEALAGADQRHRARDAPQFGRGGRGGIREEDILPDGVSRRLRDHVRHATIVLVSDLETAGEDEPALAQALLLATHDPTVDVKVLPLFPILDDLLFFRKFLPANAFINASQLHVQAAKATRFRLLVASPWPLVVVGALLLLALAVNELSCARVLVVRPREAGS